MKLESDSDMNMDFGFGKKWQNLTTLGFADIDNTQSQTSAWSCCVSATIDRCTVCWMPIGLCSFQDTPAVSWRWYLPESLSQSVLHRDQSTDSRMHLTYTQFALVLHRDQSTDSQPYALNLHTVRISPWSRPVDRQPYALNLHSSHQSFISWQTAVRT